MPKGGGERKEAFSRMLLGEARGRMVEEKMLKGSREEEERNASCDDGNER